MRVVMSVAVVLALSLACGGSGDGRGATPVTPSATPSPTATPSTTEPDAGEIVRLSDDAMNMLTGVKTEVSAENDAATVVYEAPDRSQVISAIGEGYRCVAGSRVWRRQVADDGTLGPWELSEEAATAWRWPDYERAKGKAWSESEIRVLGASGVEEFRLVEETEFAGEEVWVITYDYSAPTTEGPVPVKVTEWISKDTYWLLKVDEWQDDPFGFTGTTTTVYSRHNQPQDIECPPTSDDGAGA